MKIKTVALALLFTLVAQNACADIFTGILGAVAAPIVSGDTKKKSRDDDHDFHPLVSTAVAAVGVAAIGVTIECSKPENKYDERCLAAKELSGGGDARDLVYDRGTEKLRKNLKAAGELPPKDCAAHHIVAQTKKKGKSGPAAIYSREVLSNCNIDIDDAVNGVYLPQKSAPECTGADHKSLHTDKYYSFVAKALFFADQQGCDKVKDKLGDIKTLLQNNETPWERD